jgi:carbamoyl-phosphate synthase large subunit
LLRFHVGTFDKFEGADRTLGLQMKSVGEVMTFISQQEALQKRLNL